MKRFNGLHDKICTLENIELADKNARKGKHNWGIIKHDQHAEEDNKRLLKTLETLSYITSKYSKFKIYEPKEKKLKSKQYPVNFKIIKYVRTKKN